MTSRFITAAAVGSGLAGGVFFAFSTFVMSGLRRLPPAQGVAAMQSINRQAPTPAFMGLLFGTAAIAVGVGVHALAHRDQPEAVWVGVGTASYLASIVMTGAFHIPRNNRLDSFDATSSEAAKYWTTFARDWTAGNHVRTIACAAAAAAFTIAARIAA